MDSKTNQWILGDAFLRGFYSAHDHKSKKFGFAPHSLSEKKSPVRGTTPPETLPVELEEDEVIWIIIGAVAGALVIGLALYFILRPKLASGHKQAKVRWSRDS